MPRKNRHDTVCTDSVNHIFHRGLNSCALFKNDGDYEYYRSLILRYKDKYDIKVYNYCLMPNYLHMLVLISKLEHLSKFVQALSLAYSAYYRKSYGHSGYLFQGRYKNLSIPDESHLLECARYIERNPVRAGEAPVEDLGQHRWSSYNFYVNSAPDAIITRNPLFDRLGDTDEERRSRYKEYILTPRPYERLLDDVFHIPGEEYAQRY